MKKWFLYMCATSFASGCGQAELTEPPLAPTTGLVVLATVPSHLSNANCSMESTDGSVKYGPIPSGQILEAKPGLYEPTCGADGYTTNKGTPFFLKSGDSLVVGVSLTAIKPPPVTTGTVVLTTKPSHLNNTSCSIESNDKLVKYGPVNAGVNIEAKAGLYEPTCVADGYQTTRGTLFFVKAGDSLVVEVQLMAIIPPADTSATIWVASNIPAHVDSLVRYSINGVRTSSTTVAGNTPLRTKVTADGSLFVFWVSASGYVSLPVSSSPKPGDVVTLEAYLEAVPATRPKTGTLLIASNPTSMNASIRAIAGDGKETFVKNVVTNIILTLESGFYHVLCSDQANNFSSVSVYAAVDPGENSVAVCSMPEVAKPPASPTVSLSVSTNSINSGESVVVTVSGTNVAGISLSPLGILTLGGSFTDRPFATTQYCAVGFGPGGNTLPVCQTVTVRPPAPNLRPDTVRITFPDPTVTASNPRVWLWGQEVKLTGPYVGPVQLRVRVYYTSTKLESFAIRMQNPDQTWAGYVLSYGSSNPVVQDIAGASGWTWSNVGYFTWLTGSSYRVWAEHGSLFGPSGVASSGSTDGHGNEIGPVSFSGIEFIRWIPVSP